MNVTFEKKDDLNGSISVNIGTEDYLPLYEKKLKDYSKKANIPGFRPGHAPKGMVEKMVGNSLLLDEINGLASKGLFDYIEENKMHILGQPILAEDTKIDALTKDTNYTFTFDIGLSPQIDLNISNADTYGTYDVEITDEMINEEVDRLKKKSTALTDADVAEDGDLLYVALTELTEEGTPLEGGVNAASVPLAINTIKDDELRKSFAGLQKEALLTVNIFTLFNHDETEMSHALSVQKAGIPDLNPTFNLTVKEIKRKGEVAMNQEFFDGLYGKDVVTSEEEMREKIRVELQGYFNQQATHLLEHELFDSLVAKHNIQLPDAFLKRWLIDRHPDKFNAENVEKNYLPEANYLKNHILEEKILLDNGIKIEEDEIRQAALNNTRSMFGAYGNQGISDELLMSIVEPQLKKEDFRSRMINVAARAKVNEYILNTITLEPKKVSADEFFKIMEAHNAQHHHTHDHDHDHEHEHDHNHDHDHDHNHEEITTA